jgi:hypothetical protein
MPLGTIGSIGLPFANQIAMLKCAEPFAGKYTLCYTSANSPFDKPIIVEEA